MKLDALRLDASAINGLTTLKRRTGIETRNVLCRWAFCASLGEKSSPRADVVSKKRETEIAWDTFGGEHSEIYLGLLKERCKKEGLELTRENLSDVLHRHVHRGIGYLLSESHASDLPGLLKLAS